MFLCSRRSVQSPWCGYMLSMISWYLSLPWAAAGCAVPSAPEPRKGSPLWCRGSVSPTGHPLTVLGGCERPAQVAICPPRFQLVLIILSFLAVCPATFRSQHQKQGQQPDLDCFTSSCKLYSQIPGTKSSSEWSCFSNWTLGDRAYVLDSGFGFVCLWTPCWALIVSITVLPASTEPGSPTCSHTYAPEPQWTPPLSDDWDAQRQARGSLGTEEVEWPYLCERNALRSS